MFEIHPVLVWDGGKQERVENMYQAHQAMAGRMLTGPKADILTLPTLRLFPAVSPPKDLYILSSLMYLTS